MHFLSLTNIKIALIILSKNLQNIIIKTVIIFVSSGNHIDLLTLYGPIFFLRFSGQNQR